MKAYTEEEMDMIWQWWHEGLEDSQCFEIVSKEYERHHLTNIAYSIQCLLERWCYYVESKINRKTIQKGNEME